MNSNLRIAYSMPANMTYLNLNSIVQIIVSMMIKGLAGSNYFRIQETYVIISISPILIRIGLKQNLMMNKIILLC
jgi:hypothetical protein